jgi:hypothetical protein
MKKNFRTVKASLIMGILLISIFAIFLPVSSVKAQGGGLFGYASIVDIWWEGENESGVIVTPYEELIPYTLEVRYSITRGPFGRAIYSLFYTGRRADIKLEIIDYPEWSNVYLPTNTMTIPLQTNPTKMVERSITIMIGVAEDAPAFLDGTISIRATVPKIGMIQEFDKTIQLPFKPDYLPLIDAQANIQHKLIGPMDTAEIPIRVTNYGNGKTKALFRVTSVPENWGAIVTDQIILEPDQEDTIYLSIKPPKSFGYHDDLNVFTIEFIPAWAENIAIRGLPEQITVLVESRGISVIGIEVILPIIMLIILIIYAIYYVNKRIRR